MDLCVISLLAFAVMGGPADPAKGSPDRKASTLEGRTARRTENKAPSTEKPPDSAHKKASAGAAESVEAKKPKKEEEMPPGEESSAPLRKDPSRCCKATCKPKDPKQAPSGCSLCCDKGKPLCACLTVEKKVKAICICEIEVAGIELEGRLLDKKKKLLSVLGMKKGDKLDSSALLKNLTNIRSNLDRLGYHVTVLEWWKGNQVFLKFKISPVRLVRHVHVKGNWPLFDTDILRHMRYRPGSRLPPPKETKEAFKRQRKRILDFLSKEGYFGGDLEIVIEKTAKPHIVNLVILLRPLWQVSPILLNPRRFRLGNLQVDGNRAVTTAEIHKIFTHRFLFWKKAFTLKGFNKDIKRLLALYHKKGYAEARVRSNFNEEKSLNFKTKLVDVKLVIREGRRLDIRFVGNRKASDKTLRGAVTFFKERSADDHELAQSVVSVQRLYQRKGYFQARVYARRKTLHGEDRITFYIREGSRFKVRGVSFRFPGDEDHKGSFSGGRLSKVVKTQTYPLLGAIGLGSGGYVTAVQLKQDVDRLIRYYRERGHPDAKVWADVAVNRDSFDHPAATALLEALGRPRGKESIYVRFRILEGKRVQVERVDFFGGTPKILSLVKRRLGLRRGKPFSKRSMDRDALMITRACANQGYPYSSVSSKFEASSSKKGVVIQHTIKLGPTVRFGDIFVRGNFKTSTRVIKNELVFRKGQRFSLSKIEQSRRNLRSLAIFRSVRISFLGFRAMQKVVQVLVEVTERYDDYGWADVGFGASTDNWWFVNIRYVNKNLFGWAKQVEAFMEWGQLIQRAKLTFKDPRFLTTNLILDVTGFIRNEETERLGQLLTFGFWLAVVKRISERMQVYVRYEFKSVRRKEQLIRVASALDEKSAVDVFTNTAAIGPTFVWDKRDNPLLPKKGFKITTSVRWASKYLLADMLPAADFIHLRVGAQLFIPLPFDIVIAQGLRYDHGFPMGSTVMLPKTERFYAGGDTTVRGYEKDRLYNTVNWMPFSPHDGAAQVYKLIPEGGNIRLLYNIELQFPILKKLPLLKFPLRGAVFFDSGSIANTFAGDGLKYFFKRFRHGIGMAVRLATPVGAISLEYAFPLEPTYGTDPTGRFHFNFGFLF